MKSETCLPAQQPASKPSSLFPNFEKPDEYIKEVLTDKQATKLMSECGNIFENFIANFFVKFGKQAAAMKAYIDLDGRFFGGRHVWVCFFI